MSLQQERRLAAIVSADVVGYSRLVGADEPGTLAALSAHRAELIDPAIDRHGGRIVKTMGDGLLIEFPSVVNAVRCAMEVQTGMSTRNGGVAGDRRIVYRFGVHLGDIAVEGDDILGDGVNVAARVQEAGEPGGVALSGIARESLGTLIDAPFDDRGEQRFKNIARPVRIWRWRAPARSGRVSADQASAAAAKKPSIAVLPFDNMSDDPAQEYFSDGITEDVITELSRIPDVAVIARNSTFTYKGRAVKVQDVCHDLGVRYVLEGSVRKAGDRVRITAQLIDGHTGEHVWAERYDRLLEDIFAVQDDVTAHIVSALEVRLAGSTAPRQRGHTPHPEAYDSVLRGREQYRLFSSSGNAAAREHYERAIAIDPDYAEPYAGLAETYVQDWFMGSKPALQRAFDFARRAAARDPDLPLVQEALSTVHLFRGEHAEAIATARRWTELDASNAEAYATLAGAILFSGEYDEVIALIENAMRLNPFYPFYYPHYIGLANLGMRRLEAAAAAFERGAALSPDALWPHVFLAACYGHLGADGRAAAHAAETRRINPEFSVTALRHLLPYKNDVELDFLVEGLRAAGLAAA